MKKFTRKNENNRAFWKIILPIALAIFPIFLLLNILFAMVTRDTSPERFAEALGGDNITVISTNEGPVFQTTFGWSTVFNVTFTDGERGENGSLRKHHAGCLVTTSLFQRNPTTIYCMPEDPI